MQAADAKASVTFFIGPVTVVPYLSKVPDVKEVKGLKELAFLHAKDVAARCQESPDVLQAQELCRGDRKGSCVSGRTVNLQAVS